MKQKEEAIEIFDRYVNLYPHPTEEYLDTDEAKLCALIAVDKVLSVITAISGTEYWQEHYEGVKKEIEKLT